MKIEALDAYSKMRNLNLGQAEKDYYQNIVLFSLFSKFSKEIIFKGGTAIAKCYGLNRFSEDLDFTCNVDADYKEKISHTLEDFSVKYIWKEELKKPNAKKYKLKIEGPLYNGTLKTLCSITLDFSFREIVLLEPKIKTIGYGMDILPVFEVMVMDETEIVAEKIRAIMSRTSARDLFDLVFLLRLGGRIDEELIAKKLDYYSLNFNKKQVIEAVIRVKPVWKSELKSLVRNVPDFEEYFEEIKKRLV